MSVLTDEEIARFTHLANQIEDPQLKTNALALLERMTVVIEGMGDRPLTWLPTQVKVLQSMSNMDNVTADDPRDVTAGSLVAGNRVVPNGLKVRPLLFNTGRSLWDNSPDNARKLCSSPDGKMGRVYGECYSCVHSRGVEEGSLPACNKELVFMVIADDLSDIYRLNFAKSQYRSGLDWSKEIATARVNPYQRAYTLHGEASEKNKKIKMIKARLVNVREEGPTPAVLAFIAALADKQTLDRRIFLVEYHDYVTKRLAQLHSEAKEEQPRLTYEDTAKVMGEDTGDTVDDNGTSYRL